MSCNFCSPCALSFSDSREAHITVDLGTNTFEDFKEACEEFGCKALDILLLSTDRLVIGKHVMTSYVTRLSEEKHQESVANLRDWLTSKGFRIRRIKLEKPISDVLITDRGYYEAHIDSLTKPQIRKLGSLDYALSYNTYKEQNILSCRDYASQKSFLEKVAVLEAVFKGHKIVKEFCYYDSNPGLDNEWFEKS